MAIEGRTGITGSGDASFDVLTQANADLARKVDQLTQAATASEPRKVSVITPGSPWIVSRVQDPEGEIDTVAIELPPSNGIQWVRAIYRVSTEGVEKNKEVEWADISLAESNAQHIERALPKPLRNDTTYGLVALIAKGEFPNSIKSRNPDPPDDLTFLLTWTTNSFFSNDPSKPDIGLLIENKFDDVTKAFDAFVVARVYAPINGIYTAYTGTVTINGTTTVTGTVSFVGQVSIGMLISVSNQVRKVTNVVTNTITVDVAFVGSASGLALLWGTAHTWQSALVTRVIPRFRLTDDANAKPISEPHDISDNEQTQDSIDIRIPGFIAARKYDWVQNLLIGESGRRHVLAASTQTFIAGGFTNATAGIPELTSPSWKYDNQPPYSDQLRNTQLYLTQPNPPVALDRRETHRRFTGTGTIAYTNGVANITGTGTAFLTECAVGNQIVVGVYLAGGYQRMIVTSITDDTHLAVESSSLPTATASGQAYKVGKIIDEAMARRAKFHPTGGGQIKFNLGEIKTKKLTTQDFVNVLYAQNGSIREDVDNFTTGASGEVLTDTAVPTLATNPDTGTTGPTVQQRHAKIDVTCKIPSANIATLDNYQVVLSTQNTAPAGDPTLLSEGVQVIKYGQFVTFNLNYLLDQVTGDVWVYFRAHNQFSTGYSVWSAGTNQHGYSRVIDEFMGTAVPRHAMGLDRSGTGAAVTNTTTTYQLDAGASSVANYYVGMAIHVPSMASILDRVRTITAYNNSTKVVTFAAMSAAPGSAVAFEIHYGQAFADKMATGNTTTVIQTGASPALNEWAGYSMYMPSAAAPNQIRRIISNTTGGAATLEVATGVALPNNACGIICRGSFGTANVDGTTGIIAPVPARSYYDSGTGEGVLEMILPTGENAYGLNDGQVQRYRSSSGAIKDSQKIGLTGTPVYRYNPPVNAPTLTFYARNGYRLNGSDGKSASTYYVQGYLSSGGTITGYGGYSVASGNTYDPGTFVPIDSDPLAQVNKPASIFSTY